MMHTHGYQQNAWFNSTQAVLTLSVSKDFFRRRLNVKLTGNDLFPLHALQQPTED